MKVVLIHGKYFNSWEALGLGYIAAYLRHKIPEVSLCFFQGVFDSDEAILSCSSDADWVLFSCTSPTYKWAGRLATIIKTLYHARTVIGGYHASACPQMVGPQFDHVVIGEGEDAAYRLISGQETCRFVLGRPMRFEELPWPDRKLIRNERNIQVAARDNDKRITSFQSHRGCPFSCKFCADGARKVFYPDGKPVCRTRDIDNLLAEIALVSKKYRLDFFKFCDPTWNIDKEWVKEFCGQKTTTRTPPYFANIHAGVCDEEMFSLMSRSGCEQVGMGIESGSDRVLQAIGKRATKDQIRQAVQWCKHHGIYVRGYFILGVPEETEDDIKQTEAFAEELDLDEYGFSLLCPYPGTDYYHRNPSLWTQDWEGTDEYANDFWHTETVSNVRLRETQAGLVAKFRERITQHQRRLSDEP